jgi:hypothetical protein
VSESAFTVWGGLLAACLLAIAALALLTVTRSDGDRRAKVGRADCAALQAEAQELEKIASAAFAKALAAADTAARAAGDLDNAETFRDEIGRLQDATARALEDAIQRLSLQEPEIAVEHRAPPAREASHAAMAAFRRGAISVEQLHALWQQIDGWDAGQQEQAHELTRLRAEDVEARRRYDAAALAARNARQAYDIAQVASRALTQEAADAAQEAQEARLAAQDCLRRTGRQPR